jgi:hypothetical protein
VPEHVARITVQLDHPPGPYTGVLVERFHSRLQDAACELERVDSAEVRNLAEKVAIDVERGPGGITPRQIGLRFGRYKRWHT